MNFNDDDFEEKKEIIIGVDFASGSDFSVIDGKVLPQFNTMIEGLPNSEYHSFGAISASGLKQAFKDPKLYANKDKLMRLPSPALDMGTATHEALLEPQFYDADNYKLTPANHTKLEIMINNGKVMFENILCQTENEKSLFFQDNGFIRKVRVDAYDKEKGILYDVKTTRYNSKSKFIKDAYDLGYHLQASFYLDTLRLAGFKADYFAFLVIPSESPCEPFAIQVSDRFIEDGRAIYSEVIENIMNYDKTNDSVYFHTIDLPQWRINQLENI